MKQLLALAAIPVLLGACALPPAPANAAASSVPEDKGEEITGSRIKRKDAGIATVGREDFEAARQSTGQVPGRGQ